MLGTSPPPPTARCQVSAQLSETSDPESDSVVDEADGDVVIFNRQITVGYGGGKDGCAGVLNSFETEVIKVKNIIGRL